MKIKLIIGIVITILAVFILTIISEKSLNNLEEYQLLNGKIQYEKGVRLLDSDLENAKKQLEISYGLGFYKSVAPLGSYYLKKGDISNAELYLKLAVDSIHLYSQKNQRVIYNELAIALAKQNDMNSARVFWEKAASLGSKDAENNLK